MVNKLQWTRLFADQWIVKLVNLPGIECSIYVLLRLKMLHTGEPLLNNLKILSRYTGYSVKRFEKALDFLIDAGYIIVLEDGNLWDPEVAKELNSIEEDLDCFDEDLDNLTLHENMGG
ncbi:DUF1376 domain-containing protein [Bartonella rattaustraliani]|uniref:DUF1376 domain-containing protein n=1 Tax=Bartonella rattaustraliani TaxID=481139 RepID=UPI00037FE4EF|nr:DUF1376 domain-containing protein [Bartonella rattaustraliani]